MKKIVITIVDCVVLISGLFILFGNSSGQDKLVLEPAQPRTPTKVEFKKEVPVELQVAEPTEDDFTITKEQFESLSVAKQQEILEEFVDDFWEMELGISDETNAEEKSEITNATTLTYSTLSEMTKVHILITISIRYQPAIKTCRLCAL